MSAKPDNSTIPATPAAPPGTPPAKLTPMMQQYIDVKRTLPRDTLLLFRLGDFFEMFNDDALVASRLLGLTLTKRIDVPMCGIPAHALDNYVGKLLALGKKVGICDQAEPAKAGKLVRRQLTRILTPGTTLDAAQIDAARNHYLCALAHDRHGLHAAWLDLTTGEFKIATDPSPANLLPILTALDPAELITPENALPAWQQAAHDHANPAHASLAALATFAAPRLLTELPGYQFDPVSAPAAIATALGVLNLQGFGLENTHPALGPAAALVHYATENLCAKPENLRGLQEYRPAKTLLLDPATLRNLEIFNSTRGARDGSLHAAMNRTTTPAGARLLERWLAAPTLDLAEIRRRQTITGELLAMPGSLSALRASLQHIRDIPRIISRLQNRLRNPRELGGIRDTLAQLPKIHAALAQFPTGTTTYIQKEKIDLLPRLHARLARALADELPNDINDGNHIRPACDPELDRLRALTTGNKTWLSDLERTEQERTGIRSLKVKYTGNFGYYIEVTKANLHLVPPDYIRRQTTVGGERYVTEALKQKEKEIFHAEENALAREITLFTELVTTTLDDSVALVRTAETLAELDVLCGWATLAREWDYTRPEIDETDTLEITEGRHPVVEQMLKTPETGTPQTFVPNDTQLSSTESQIALITGPNMAGKSTYIRQVALITLMAQVGCWVPAKTCRIGLVDRIFSRVGASDDLARGNSTFMVEMNETANILNNTTDRSLIILDEIGRGTSTYDGLSIAWAVVEHLHRDETRGPRTLFATHYQELTQLEKHLPRMRNLSVAVKEWNDEIVFVRRVIPGAADRSYGIQVARLAGLPLTVIDRAKTILAKLESEDTEVELSAPSPKTRPKKKITVRPGDDAQMSLL